MTYLNHPLLAFVFFVGLMGALIGGILPTKRHVTEQVTKEVKEVTKGPEGCLDGQVGELKAVNTSHEATGHDDDWQFMTLAVFKTKDDSYITCKFYQGPLDQVWAVGMKMKVTQGEQIAGSYK